MSAHHDVRTIIMPQQQQQTKTIVTVDDKTGKVVERSKVISLKIPAGVDMKGPTGQKILNRVGSYVQKGNAKSGK